MPPAVGARTSPVLDLAALRAALSMVLPDGSARSRLLRSTACAVALASAARTDDAAPVREVARRLALGPDLTRTLLRELAALGVVERTTTGHARLRHPSCPGCGGVLALDRVDVCEVCAHLVGVEAHARAAAPVLAHPLEQGATS